MSPRGIPPAKLGLVRVVADAVAAGVKNIHQLERRCELTLEEADAALSAGRLLRVLDGGLGLDQDVALTQLGRDLVATKPSSAEEAQVLRTGLEASQELAGIAGDLLANVEPTLAELADRLEALMGLRARAALRSAGTLRAWRRSLLGGHIVDHPSPAIHRGWRRLHVENYRSIGRIVVDLPPFSMLVGPNGSGKSNVADALLFAAEVGVNASAAIHRRGGIDGIRRWTPEDPADIVIDCRIAASANELDTNYLRHRFVLGGGLRHKWSFLEEVVEIVVGGHAEHRAVRTGEEVDYSWWPTRLPFPAPDASILTVLSQLEDFSAAASLLGGVRRYRPNPDAMREPIKGTDATRLDELGTNIALAVQNLEMAGEGPELENRLSKIVPGLVSLTTDNIGSYSVLRIRQEQGKGGIAELDATGLSDGSLRALGLLVATLQQRRNELLIIEEPEVSVHVAAANLLYDVLREAADKGSVLVTTHSPDLVEAAADEEILVCEYVGGMTRLGSLDPVQRQIVEDGLFSLSELMRSEPLRVSPSD